METYVIESGVVATPGMGNRFRNGEIALMLIGDSLD